jgi:hypothetical protein
MNIGGLGNFNAMMNRHFKGNEEIDSYPDRHRNRTIRIFFIGQPDVVGVSDGIDSWIAPVSCFGNRKVILLVAARVAKPRVKLLV